MPKVNTVSTITQYELMGDEKRETDAIMVRSHWNRKDFVEIKVRDGETVSVVAADLKKAIDRCSG